MSAKFNTKIFYTIISAALLTFCGCSKQSEPSSYIYIDDQYEVKLHQLLTESGGVPSLQINTLRAYECLNSYIAHQTIITNEKIKLFLNDVLVEGDCMAGNGIIREEVSVKSANSAIPIEIILKNVVTNTGTLYSNNLEIEMILDNFDGLKISKTHINRIYPKLIWGSFNANTTEVKQLITDYLASIDLDIAEAKGDYGHFYVAQDESISIYDNEYENPHTFLISTDETFKNVKTKIQEFEELDPSLVFQATNYDGSALNIH